MPASSSGLVADSGVSNECGGESEVEGCRRRKGANREEMEMEMGECDDGRGPAGEERRQSRQNHIARG